MNREDLYKCRSIEMGIRSMQEIYEMKFNQAVKTTQTLSDMPKALNKVKYELEELIDFYDEKIRKKQLEFNELTMGIEKQLDKMKDERHISVLRYYYLCGLSVKDTAEKMSYEEKYTNKLKTDAIDEFEIYDTKSH